MRPFLVAVVLAAPLISFAQVTPATGAFVIVRGAQYEGAIVPESSPWRQALFQDPGIRNDYSGHEGWTPTAKDVAVAEGALHTFVERFLAEVKSTSGSYRVVSYRDAMVRGDIRALADRLPALKRQYAGLAIDTDRTIFVHGFADQPGWQTEPIFILDAGCNQFWMDFSVNAQRVTRLRCGGLA
jgi:hypothetical protein